MHSFVTINLLAFVAQKMAAQYNNNIVKLINILVLGVCTGASKMANRADRVTALKGFVKQAGSRKAISRPGERAPGKTFVRQALPVSSKTRFQVAGRRKECDWSIEYPCRVCCIGGF